MSHNGHNGDRSLCYLAGPYRGAVRANIRAAEYWAGECAKRGVHFICPHLNSAFMDDVAEPEFWLEMDKDILSRCDAMLLLPGWQTSEGAQAERAYAVQIGKPIFYVAEYLEEKT